MDLDAAYISWDDPGDIAGNTWHIAPTGLTEAEIEAVIRDPRYPVQVSRGSGRRCKLGELSDGRRVFVAWDVECDNPPVVRPVTAYVVNP